MIDSHQLLGYIPLSKRRLKNFSKLPKFDVMINLDLNFHQCSSFIVENHIFEDCCLKSPKEDDFLYVF